MFATCDNAVLVSDILFLVLTEFSIWHCRQNRCNSIAVGALSASNHSDIPLPAKSSSLPKKIDWSGKEESDPNFEVLMKGMKILLAEDNLVNQKVACQQLKKFGIQVDVVCDGQQCLDTLEARRDDYDLILMDVQVNSNFFLILIFSNLAELFETKTSNIFPSTLDSGFILLVFEIVLLLFFFFPVWLL